MSTNEDGGADDSGTTETSGDSGADAGPGTREVAYRLFATEFEDSELSYSESDEERAPNYVVTPTGLRLNRLFTVGVLTEVERLNSDTLRGRIVDPTGAFVTYAGQYQPEAQAFLDGADSPSFVAITGKARTFEPDDADRIFTSVRPESLSEVTADTRDRWTVSVAEATLERLAVVAAALDADLQGDELRAALETAGVDAPLAAGIPRALDYYGTTTAYLEAIRRVAVDALEVVTGERDEVRPVDVAPDEGGSATLGPLPDVGIDLAGDATESAEPAETAASAMSESADPTATADTEAATATADTAESSEPTTGSTESATEPTESATEPSEPATEPTEAATEPTESATEPSEPATTSAESTTESTTTEAATETTAESTTTATSDDSSPPDTATTATSDDPSPADTATESTTAESSSTATDREPTASSEPATTDDGVTDTDDVGDTVDDTADEPEMYQLDDEEREELESEFGADFSSGNEVDPAGEADIDVPDAEELAAEAAEGEPSDGDTVTAESTPADTAESPTTDATPTETSDPAESTDSTETLGSFEDTIDDTAGSATDTESDRSAASDDADGDDSDTTTTDGDAAAAGSEATDIDLEDAAVELMAELDAGDGADREAVVEEVAAAHGVEPAAVEDAIDDALMGGRCYEPDEGTLKPI